MNALTILIDLYCWVLILDVILSWFIRDPRHELRVLLGQLTDPVLSPIRKVVRTPGLDFSAMIAILILQGFGRFLSRL